MLSRGVGGGPVHVWHDRLRARLLSGLGEASPHRWSAFRSQEPLRATADGSVRSAVRQPQLAGEPVDLRLARKRKGEPVTGTRRGAVHEDLVTVELLGDLWVDHRADDEDADRIVAVVLQLVCAAPTHKTRDDLSRLELAHAVKRPERRAPAHYDDHLLVAVVEVKRRAATAAIDLVQRRAKPLRTSLSPDARGSSDQRRLVTLDPLGLEDVRHAVKLATTRARVRQPPADQGRPEGG